MVVDDTIFDDDDDDEVEETPDFCSFGSVECFEAVPVVVTVANAIEVVTDEVVLIAVVVFSVK